MKRWESPKLIVLVRVRPEESLLVNCKTYSGPTAGPDADDWWCVNYDCDLCYQEANS